MLDYRIFSEFFIEFDQLLTRHHILLQKDRRVAGRLRLLLELFRNFANKKRPVPHESALSIVKKMDETECYIRDRAEEVWHIVEDTHDTGGNEKRKADRYLALLQDVDAFASEYKYCVLQIMSPLSSKLL